MSITKKITLFIFSLLVISCSDDASTIIDVNAQAEDLIGTWNLTAESQDGTVTTEVVAGVPVNGNITSVGKNLNTQFIFTDNPNNFEASGGYTDAVKISVAGITLGEGDLVVPISELINQGTWAIDQGMLSLTQNSIVQTVIISELTSTMLKIEFDIEEDNVTFEDFTGDIQSTIKMTFTKQ